MVSFLKCTGHVKTEDIDRIINDIAEIDFDPDVNEIWCPDYAIPKYTIKGSLSLPYLLPMPNTRAFYYDDHSIGRVYRRGTTIFIFYQSINESGIIRNLIHTCETEPKLTSRTPYGMIGPDIKIMFQGKK